MPSSTRAGFTVREHYSGSRADLEAEWTELGLRYQLADVDPPSPVLVRRVENQFGAHGLTVM